MREFTFEPGYYEWHLKDADGNTVHVMEDPTDYLYDYLYDEEDERIPYEDIYLLCKESLDNADYHYNEGKDYNGIFLEEDDRLTSEEIEEAAEIMAETLDNYYSD